MPKSTRPHHVPPLSPTDYLAHAANAKHEARWCVRNGRYSEAWGLFHKQQHFYLKHATRPGSAFTPAEIQSLNAEIHEDLANILRLESKHRMALAHLVYCLAATQRPKKGLARKLPAYFNRAKVVNATLGDAERLIRDHRRVPDLKGIVATVGSWESASISN